MILGREVSSTARRNSSEKMDKSEAVAKRLMGSKWCVWQKDCSDSVEWACTAHAFDGHIFDCPFTPDDIDPRVGKPRRKIKPKGGDGVCQDYESPEE